MLLRVITGVHVSILTRGMRKTRCIFKSIRSKAVKMAHSMILSSLLKWLRKLLKTKISSAKTTEKKQTMRWKRGQRQKYLNSIRWLMRCSRKTSRSFIGVVIFYSANLTEELWLTKKAGTQWLQNHSPSIFPSESQILLSKSIIIQHLNMVQIAKKKLSKMILRKWKIK